MSATQAQSSTPGEAPLIDLILRPHRSLSLTGFKILMGLVIALNLFGAIVFIRLGAWPMLPFLGVDVAALWWAFRLNYKAAQAFEEICITYDGISLKRVNAKGAFITRTYALLGTKLCLEQQFEEGLHRLYLCFRHDRLELASDLPPTERKALYNLLNEALLKAKAGRSF